ncbi:MAG: methionine adenosyltransferase [Microbacteriaceae bacterium]|nr:methionine adenosyltransferase [Microbacteriaceae bacterium]MDR9443473.1 methionine adenosyltransferase [Microbacteriaceae bacterium]
MSNYLFSSESVTEGHPDKLCDQISDAILDEMLRQDKNSRVAIESLVTTGLVHIAGEVRTQGYVEIPELVRKLITDIGYTSSKVGFDGASCGVSVSIGAQSPEIAAGVDNSLESRTGSDDQLSKLGAGDQGIMFGFASDETPELMPMPIVMAHRLTERLSEVRKNGQLEFLRPDGKAQVTLEYENGAPVRLDTVVISTQHDEQVDNELLSQSLIDQVIKPVVSRYGMEIEGARILINPSGKFVIGGPQGDAGLTGRKVIVDTYGGFSRHGGGAFSGKDPSKVDRSAAYAMRWVAKNIVASGAAKKAEVQVAYAIGVSEPVSLMVDTFGTGQVDDQKITKAVRNVFDLRPGVIIQELDLLRPIYLKTATYGHFGREDQGFSWEETNKASEIAKELGL